MFCDWHLELAKPVLQGEATEAAKAETRATIAHVLDLSYAMLHPFMPFLTEELWAIKGAEGPPRDGAAGAGRLAGAARRPSTPRPKREIGWVVELIEADPLDPLGNGDPAERAAAAGAGRAERRGGGLSRALAPTLERLARIEGVDVAAEPPPGSLAILVRDAQAALPLAGLVDFAAERARLDKEIAKERAEIAKVDVKLDNADFLFRAPEEIVEENRERREAALARIAKLEAARDQA